jgi:CRISPR-associated protein Csx14
VLVTPDFESNHDFFYKPKKDTVIKSNGKRLHTKNARITLAELPIIRLRNKVSLGGSNFKELVREGQKEIDMAMIQPELRINFAERQIRIGQKLIQLPPLHLMIYTAYLKRKLYYCKYPKRPYCHNCTDCYPSLLDLSTKTALEEMAKDYMKISVSRAEDLLYKYKDGLKHEVIRQPISKIKKAIGDVVKDEALTSYYAITSPRREYFTTRHGVRVEKGKIRIE